MSTQVANTSIAPSLFSDAMIQKYKNQFSNGQPYKHLVIDNFLVENMADSLYNNFPKITELRKHYKGLNENKSEGSSFDKYGNSFLKVLESIKSKQFINWLEQVTSINELSLPDDHRGAGVHQGKNGSFLDIHVDFSVHPVLNLHRRLNLLIFLNKGWKKEWGGLLELWNEDVSVCHQEIIPAYNRAVIFETTDTSYHGYDTITVPEGVTRKSIYSYYYSPLGKNVKYHDTIFKPRPTDSALKKTQTNTKELIKNTIKKTMRAVGFRSIFNKFE